MRWLADFLYLLAGLLYVPVALYQALAHGKHRSGWRERFGAAPRFDSGRQRVWIHAVSLGEVNCTPALVEGLRAAHPELDVVLSTTTDTGFARAVQLYGQDRVFRYPLDFSPVVARVLDRVHPALIVLIELEVWYNLVHLASQRGIPVVVVNGRLTERSACRLARLGGATRSMFGRLAWVGAQDEIIAARFRKLGTPGGRVEVMSSLKWDTATLADDVPGASDLRAALGLSTDEPLWVCGSTGPGEEEVLLDAQRILRDAGQAWRVALVPRKPERFDEVARIIERRGLRCIRRTHRPDPVTPPPQSEPDGSCGSTEPPASGGSGAAPRSEGVILGDTLGELRKFYALATAVFVGRSLVPMGGSDPIEVAALAKPILCGPHMENFAAAVAALDQAGALVRVVDARQIAEVLIRMAGEPGASPAMGRRGRTAVLNHQGATGRTLARLAGFLSPNPVEARRPESTDPARRVGHGATETATSPR